MREKKAREKERVKRAARKERDRLRREKRRAKTAQRLAPRKRLAKWSQRVRATGRCVVCGKKCVTQAHHLLPKERYPEFKFKAINGVELCPNHHKFSKFSAHRNPVWFVVWLRQNRPWQYDWCVRNMGTWDGAIVPA